MRWGLAGALRRAFGAQALPAPYGTPELTTELDAAERDAVVEAFQGLSPPFVWSEGRWRLAGSREELMPAFVRRLYSAPVQTMDDRRLMARMLATLAKADDVLGKDEWEFLTEFIDREVGAIDYFMDQPPPDAALLATASPGTTRETLLMVAWALASADAEISPAEQATLEGFARGLGLAEDVSARLRDEARAFLFDRALSSAYPRGTRDPKRHAEVVEFGRRLGLDDTTLQALELNYARRNNH